MRLDTTDLRYLSTEEFHVLKACETGSLSHEVVPSSLIASTSGLHHAGLNKIMSELARRGLIARERNIKYDGWRLTYGGYDWLAVRAMREKGALLGVGTRVGVGKESDIYMAHQPPSVVQGNNNAQDDDQLPPVPAVLKVHRLGRISFRKIKEKRDYLGHRSSAPNWMYLSRLAAKKEWLFMQTLYDNGFPVPRPIRQSRHAILMSRINGYPLRQIVDLPQEHVAALFASLMALVVRLARAGLIHCDFNEFNIMVREAGKENDEGVDGAEEEDDDEDEEGIWARAKGLVHGESQQDEEEEGYKLRPGEKLVKGNGFERIYTEKGEEQNDSSDEDDDEDENDEDEDDEEEEEEDEEEEFDENGTNEGLRVQLKDGSSIEPILIDFPQMISVEHVNAEYYFDRDVQGVCSFFKRRFRYHSDNTPSFRAIVPLDRQKQREARASRRAQRGKAVTSDEKEAQDEESREEDERLGLELDVFTQASGLGSVSKEMSSLEQYMATMRVRTENGADVMPIDGNKNEDEKEDEEGEEEDDDEEEDEIASRLQNGTLLPPSTIVPTGRGLARQSRSSRKPDRTTPKRSAAKPTDVDIEARIAAERQRRSRQDAKHHGRKAQAGKAGRTYASGGGSKAKTSDKALLDNSLQF